MVRSLTRTAFAAMAGAAALLACRDPTGPGAELRQARRRWAVAEPAAYRFTLEQHCFCLFEITRPVVVTVRGGTVESRRYEDTGAPVDARWAGRFPAIEGLFAVIDTARARRAHRLVVTYDGARGHPVRIDIDYAVNVADDEIEYVVRDLQPL